MHNITTVYRDKISELKRFESINPRGKPEKKGFEDLS